MTSRRYALTNNLHLLGSLGILGSPGILVADLTFGFRAGISGPIVGVTGIVYFLGWACSMLALVRLHALGESQAVPAVFSIQFLAMALGFISDVQLIVTPDLSHDSLLWQLPDACCPISHLLMLVVGVVALRAHRLVGWRRLTPLFCSLTFPLAFLVDLVAGGLASEVALATGTTIAFALLGYAVYTSQQLQIIRVMSQEAV